VAGKVLTTTGLGHFEGNAMIRIGSVPVKTRVPLRIWALAAVLAFLSVASSTVHLMSDDKPGAEQKALHAQALKEQSIIKETVSGRVLGRLYNCG
jgi:hypothetical protein